MAAHAHDDQFCEAITGLNGLSMHIGIGLMSQTWPGSILLDALPA